MSLLKHQRSKHVRVMTDSATAISFINKQGGVRSLLCNNLARSIWFTCIDLGCIISAAHIPGKHNVLADISSRKFRDTTEFMLNPIVFDILCTLFGHPSIDLFASRLNYQLDTYVSWKPDPHSTYIDAMSFSWAGLHACCFPPFSMISPVVTKIDREGHRIILIIPA